MLNQLFFTKLRECLKNFAKTKTIKNEDQEEIMQKLQFIINFCISSQLSDDSYQVNMLMIS